MFQEGRMIHLIWKRFENFLDLWDELKDIPKLIYVIGETHHCYIGTVGGRKGKDGLRQRYQKQYVDRAVAIYGMDAPEGQPAFAANLNEVATNQIESLERQVQQVFIDNEEKGHYLFKPRGRIGNFELDHQGNMPKFLQSKEA